MYMGQQITKIQFANTESTAVNVFYKDSMAVTWIPDTNSVWKDLDIQKFIDLKMVYPLYSKSDLERQKKESVLAWRKTEIKNIALIMAQYREEQGIPDEWKVMPLSSSEFDQILEYRKALFLYSRQVGFPNCPRPKISNDINVDELASLLS